MLFQKIIADKKFQYLDEKLLSLLTGFILNFSYVVTKNASTPLSANQIGDIRNCVELIDKLISHLTSIECVNHIVLSLCELLNLVRQSNASENISNLFYDVKNIFFKFEKIFCLRKIQDYKFFYSLRKIYQRKLIIVIKIRFY